MRLKKCLRACDRGLACLVLMAGCALLALCVSSCTSFERLTKVVEQFPQARACGECHVEIHREWSDSPHARAYTNPRYREGTDDYRFVACIGCHAPIPTVTEATPPARAAFREEGVTCVSCHLEEQKMLGPITPTWKVGPHAIQQARQVKRQEAEFRVRLELPSLQDDAHGPTTLSTSCPKRQPSCRAASGQSCSWAASP